MGAPIQEELQIDDLNLVSETNSMVYNLSARIVSSLFILRM